MISHFRISSSGRLRPILNHEILKRALLFLRFRAAKQMPLGCSIGSTKSDLNMSANSVNSFLREL